MRKSLIALAAALSAVAPPAMAQAGRDEADVRCLMVLQAVSRDPNQKESAARGVFFYLGRLEQRGPMSRLEAMMLTQGKGLATPELVQAELNRCGVELTKASGELQTVNQNLQKAIQPATPPAGAPPAKK